MKFAENNIQDFLYIPGKYYLIPEFQRPYSWEHDNIRSFLEDLEELSNSTKSHYFGTVVFVPDSKDLNANAIIDGQQRVTTTILMLIALQHIIDKYPEKSNTSAKEISSKYLHNTQDFVSEKGRLKLRTVTTDDKILKKIFNQEVLDAKEKQNKLYLAYKHFTDYFKDRDSLEKYINALHRFEIVTISLSGNDDNPQRVFESINSTGKPLTDGDKIRNYALMLSNESARTYVLNTYWKNIEETLTDTSGDNITDFFRTYLITKRAAIIKLNSVYPEFKKLFSAKVSEDQGREELDNFFKDIVKYLEYYAAAKLDQDPQGRFAFLQNFMFKMRYIQIELYLPLLFNLLAFYDDEKLTKEQLIECVSIIETYFARRIICNISQTSVDRLMATMHRDVLELLAHNPDEDYVSIFKYLFTNRTGATRFPDDNELFSSIETNQTYNQRKAHVNFILTAVDNQSKEASLLRQIYNKELKYVTIEHIMPQKLTSKWIEMLGKDSDRIHNEYLHTLANLTLTGYNSELSNRSFVEKKTIDGGFNESSLAINRMLQTLDQWTESELKLRQDWWKKQLTKVWPRPVTNFKPDTADIEVDLLETDDLQGYSVGTLILLGEDIQVSNWAFLLDSLIEKAFELDESFYDRVISDKLLSKVINDDDSSMRAPLEINDTGYYTETNNNTNKKLKVIKQVAKLMKWQEGDVRALVSNNSDPEDDPVAEDLTADKPDEIVELYESVHDLITGTFPSATKNATKSYVSFQSGSNKLFVHVHKSKVVIGTKLKLQTSLAPTVESKQRGDECIITLRNTADLDGLEKILQGYTAQN